MTAQPVSPSLTGDTTHVTAGNNRGCRRTARCAYGSSPHARPDTSAALPDFVVIRSPRRRWRAGRGWLAAHATTQYKEGDSRVPQPWLLTSPATAAIGSVRPTGCAFRALLSQLAAAFTTNSSTTGDSVAPRSDSRALADSRRATNDVPTTSTAIRANAYSVTGMALPCLMAGCAG